MYLCMFIALVYSMKTDYKTRKYLKQKNRLDKYMLTMYYINEALNLLAKKTFKNSIEKQIYLCRK